MGGVGSGSKPRQYPAEIVDLACEMYASGMTVAEIRAVFPKGYRVQTILERYLPERRPCAKRNQRGDKNHMWKETPGYSAAHLRLVAQNGPAGAHACADCGEVASDWSYAYGCADELDGVTGPPYCTHAKHYAPRCKRCHHRHDHKSRRANGQLAARQEVMPHV